MTGVGGQRAPRPRDRHAGQALLEFALVIPIFLTVLFGFVDAGRLVWMNTVLSQASREAARVASVEAAWVGSTDPSCNKPGGPVCPANVSALLADVNAAANRMVAPFGAISASHTFLSCDSAGSEPSGAWTTQSCISNDTGMVVSTRVEMTFSAITPVIGGLVPPINLSGFSSMVIN